MIVKLKILIGKNLFHVRFISISYRNRGYLLRIIRIKIHKIIENPIKIILLKIQNIVILPTNKQEVNNITNKIFIYSAIKIKANILPPYSVLNPDTNSLSPSLKSKGARPNSANIEIIHSKKIIFINKPPKIHILLRIENKFIVFKNIKILTKIKNILIS